MQNIVECS